MALQAQYDPVNHTLRFIGPDNAEFVVDEADIGRIIEVTSGSQMYANDFDFWIVEMPTQVLIVPDDTAGFLGYVEQRREALEQKGLLLYAVCDQVPRTWRRHCLFGLIPMRDAVLTLAPKVDYEREIPDWRFFDPHNPTAGTT